MRNGVHPSGLNMLNTIISVFLKLWIIKKKEKKEKKDVSIYSFWWIGFSELDGGVCHYLMTNIIMSAMNYQSDVFVFAGYLSFWLFVLHFFLQTSACFGLVLVSTGQRWSQHILRGCELLPKTRMPNLHTRTKHTVRVTTHSLNIIQPSRTGPLRTQTCNVCTSQQAEVKNKRTNRARRQNTNITSLKVDIITSSCSIWIISTWTETV